MVTTQPCAAPEAAKYRVLGILGHQSIANLENIARHAGLCRKTAEKYLNQLITEGKIREMKVGNNRLFLLETTGDDA